MFMHILLSYNQLSQRLSCFWCTRNVGDVADGPGKSFAE